jgi:hypothetical protein
VNADHPEPGDAAEPVPVTRPSICGPAFLIDSDRWPLTVVVAGGAGYTDCDVDWVVSKFAATLLTIGARSQLHVACAATPGAAAIIYRDCVSRRLPAFLDMPRSGEGRATEFRAAWRLLDGADRAVVFEPIDRIADRVLSLARIVETGWGRGLPVVCVPARRPG